MRFFGFGKKQKEETLEALSEEFGIKLRTNSPPEGYDVGPIKGVGNSISLARRHLFENAQRKGVAYLSGDVKYSREQLARGEHLEIASTLAYYSPTPKPAA